MKRLKRLLSIAIGLFLIGSAAPAFAVSINGSISFSDGFNLPSLGQTTSVVSQLSNIDVLNGAGITLANGCTGSFGTCTSVLIANGGASDFTIGTAPVLVFQYNGFAFTITSFDTVDRGDFTCDLFGCDDSLEFRGAGTVTGNGFDESIFNIRWTANGSCVADATSTGCAGDQSASWSASISARGIPRADGITPEPSTLFLMVIGLFGVGVLIRQRA